MPFSKDLEAELRRVADELPKIVGAELADVAGEVAAALEAGSPVRTGRLAGSWSVRTPSPGVSEVVSSASYAAYVEIDTDGAQEVLGTADDRIARRVSAALEG